MKGKSRLPASAASTVKEVRRERRCDGACGQADA
jgi:hypothetical protein